MSERKYGGALKAKSDATEHTAGPTYWANRIVRSGTASAAALAANEANWRSHGAAQQAALAAVLEHIGWVQQIVVNLRSSVAWGERRGVETLVDGHLRAELALRQGPETELPVTYVDLDPDEERLILASLDPIAAMAHADRDQLVALLASVHSDDDAVRALIEDIARQEHIALPASGGLIDSDMVPEPPVEPVAKPGDLWLLGKHRLLCGDATNVGDVVRLMDGKKAILMATDPPYLVDYQGGSHPATEANGGAADKDKHWDTYVDHEHSVAFYVDFLGAAIDHALTPEAAVYQCYGIMRSEVIWAAWREVGLLAHQVLIWKKTRSVLTYSWYMWDYEPVLVGWVQGHQPRMNPPADARAVWEIDSKIEDAPGSIHPTIKPVELIRRPITYHTKPGELIYEPFSGSGTAIIAAEETGRVCYAMELSPVFVDVACERYRRFTGLQPTLHTKDA